MEAAGKSLTNLKGLLTNPHKLRLFVRTNYRDIIIYVFYNNSDNFFDCSSSYVLLGLSWWFLLYLHLFWLCSDAWFSLDCNQSQHESILFRYFSSFNDCLFPDIFFQTLFNLILGRIFAIWSNWWFHLQTQWDIIISFLCLFNYFYSDVIYMMKGSLRSSYNKDLDAVKFYYIVAPAAVVALLFHPSLNNYFAADVLLVI